MARLPALLDTLAGFRGGPERKTWGVFGRILREHGVLPPSKRGVGATEVTVRDAANLLIAGMATESPMKAAEVLGRYAPLRKSMLLGKLRLHSLGPIYDSATLLGGVCELIEQSEAIYEEIMVSYNDTKFKSQF